MSCLIKKKKKNKERRKKRLIYIYPLLYNLINVLLETKIIIP